MNISRLKNMSLQKKVFILITCCIFIGFLIFNILTPYLADDYSYMYSFAKPEQVKTIWDAAQSVYAHAFTMNGRTIPHFFVQVFLIYNKIIFDFVNALMATLLVYLIYRHAIRSSKDSNLIYLIALALVLLFVPVLGQVIFWLDGSCNYLWSMVFILAVLLFFKNAFFNKTYKMPGWKVCLVIILAFIAGSVSENSSAACIFIMFGTLVLMKIRKDKISRWMYGSVIAALLGWGIMIMAPGNFARLNNFTSEYAFLHNIFVRALTCLRYMVIDQSILVVSFLILLILLHDKMDKKKIQWVILVFVGAICANFAMSAVPDYPERAIFGSMILMIASDLTLLSEFLKIKKCEKIVPILCVILLYAASISAMYGILDVYEYHRNISFREAYIKEELAKGNTHVRVPKIEAKTKYSGAYGLLDITNESDHWMNGAYARYYHLDTIVSTEK